MIISHKSGSVDEKNKGRRLSSSLLNLKNALKIGFNYDSSQLDKQLVMEKDCIEQ